MAGSCVGRQGDSRAPERVASAGRAPHTSSVMQHTGPLLHVSSLKAINSRQGSYTQVPGMKQPHII